MREGDEYVINGQKIFISLADFADYLWLACQARTPRPRGTSGISMIMRAA